MKDKKDVNIGDLVEKVSHPGGGRLAIVTDLSMENSFEFNAWIRIAYADLAGGYEWVHREGLKILVDD